MKVIETEIPDVRILVPARHEDARGFLAETFRRDALSALGVDREFVQENHSRSEAAGTIRGLHFQAPPREQDKLVRVVRGSVFDVAVDLRRSSPTFGHHVAVELSAAAMNQLLVPRGFAHGFCTIEPGTEVVYLLTAYYAPEHDRGLRWDDPALGIRWPVSGDAAIVSEKDRGHPALEELGAAFP